MANDIGLKVKEGIANGQTPFQEPSKRNVGLIGERKRGPENIPLSINSLAEDFTKLGGFDANMFGPIISRNLFKNAPSNSAQVYFVRLVGDGSIASKVIKTIPGTNIDLTVTAGLQGREDKGDWGNDLSVSLYAYNQKVINKWYLEVIYKDKIVETFEAETLAEMKQNVLLQSNYVVIDATAEPNIDITQTAGTGTITTVSTGTVETLATAVFEIGVAGSNGDTIEVIAGTTILGNYTVQNGDSDTDVSAALASSINGGTHGYSATDISGEVTVTGPTGSGATLNGVVLTFNVTGTVTGVEASPGSLTFSSGVDAVAPGASKNLVGSGTQFTTELTVGGVVMNSDGDFIGIVDSITDDTTATLVEVAQLEITSEDYTISSFFSLSGDLLGGVYVAPIQSDYTPISDDIAPKGLACLDGADIQILAVTENHNVDVALIGRDYCGGRGDCVFLANLPYGANEPILKDYAKKLQNNNTSFIAGYNGWVKTADGFGGYIWVPAIGCVIGAAFLRVPALQGDYIHIPPAGIDSVFVDIIDCVPNQISQQKLNKNTRDWTVNSIVYQERKGFFVMTSRTYSTNPLFHSIHIRMQTSYYVRILQNNLGWSIQKPNTPSLKKELYVAVYAYFKNEYDVGALEKTLEFAEACEIICDQTNNPLSQDRKELNLDINWVPTETAEAIKISLNRNDGILITNSVEQ